MKKLLFIFFAIILGSTVYAQSGGKKREHRNQRGGGFHLFSKKRGNASAFASHKRKNRWIARIFRGERVTAGGWVYHKSPGSHKTDHTLFHRFRTKNKVFKDKLQARINKQRAKNRKRGNSTFSKRKY